MASSEKRKSIDSTPSLAKRSQMSTPDFKASSESGNEAVREQEKTPSVGSTLFHRNGASSKKATLTDMSVFDCPICFLPFLSNVFHCENGHVACLRCNIKFENKCPICGCPIGTNRCSAMEKVLDTVAVSCPNELRGCTQMVKLNERFRHEESTCHHKPCVYPYNNCNFVDLPECLFKHFGKMHSPSTFRFNNMTSIVMDSKEAETLFFQDIGQGTLFVLKSGIEARGNYLTVACVGPVSMKGAFSFKLTVEFDKDTYVKIKGSVVCIQEWMEGRALGKCLLVPKDMVDKNGKLNLKLILRRNPIHADVFR